MSILTRHSTGDLAKDVRVVCTLRADLSGLRSGLKAQKGPKGEEFWRVDFVISVMLGGTSMKARLIWNEGVRTETFRRDHELIS